MLSFASRTWGGWDYIPDVWDRWMIATDGLLLVATRGRGAAEAEEVTPVDRPIAFSRVAMLAEGEAWLEGLRVDPAVRGRSIATYLQVAEFRWAVAHGARVVRYATAADNEASHRLGARHGLRTIGAWRSYGGEEADDAERLDQASLRERLAETGLVVRDESEAHRWWSLVAADPTFRARGGLYECRPWSVQSLTEERFAAHARRGEVLAHDGQGGPALAIVPLSALPTDESELHAGLLVGTGEGALRLMETMATAAGARPRCRLPDPDPPLLAGAGRAFRDAGFAPHDYVMHVLERRLDDGAPLPEPDDPSLLIYGDEPRSIAIPPPIGSVADPLDPPKRRSQLAS